MMERHFDGPRGAAIHSRATPRGVLGPVQANARHTQPATQVLSELRSAWEDWRAQQETNVTELRAEVERLAGGQAAARLGFGETDSGPQAREAHRAFAAFARTGDVAALSRFNTPMAGMHRESD